MKRIALLALFGLACVARTEPSTAPADGSASAPSMAPQGAMAVAEGGTGYGACTSDSQCSMDEICDAGACVYSGSMPAPEKRVEVRSDQLVFNTEAYDYTPESEFVAVADQPLSTFSVDVDTAAYSNMRRNLNEGYLPQPDAVRIEELVNYFAYDYPAPTGKDPFSVATEVGPCPWNPDTELVRIGLRGKPLPNEKLPPRNLVFLLDVSGSMDSPDKLPLLKRSMAMLTRQLKAHDRVAIAVYAGASGQVLPSTPGNEHGRVLAAIEGLSPGGSTNGAEGIELAYQLATDGFAKKGINRILLATDGDFNVGVTGRGELKRFIEDKRDSGVALSVLGFGTGNLKDSSMEQLADVGNGNYAYIDSLVEAQRVLVEQAGGTFVTIAKDVKLQVELNPSRIAEYRLIGYMNRRMETHEFTDDKKDAGEIGAGHTVTALYEIRRVAPDKARKGAEPKLRYQGERTQTSAASSDELMNVKVRFKPPQGDKSTERSFTVTDTRPPKSSDDFRFATAVATFGFKLRHSASTAKVTYDDIHTLASDARGQDPTGFRSELLTLIRLARDLDPAR